MYRYTHILYIALTIVLMCACSAETLVKKGDKAYAIGEYFTAADHYRRAYAKTPTKDKQQRGERALKMAHCYYRINSIQKAIGGFRNAIRYNTPPLTTV